MKKILFFFGLFSCVFAHSQELNAIVTVNTQQVNLSNRSVFKTLEKSLQEFINQTRWTDIKVRENERLRCSFTLVITKFENTRYEATLLVQSSRPVYNSAYQSPIFNLQDKEVSFEYQEFAPLSFNENSFESNLTSVVAYYAYLLLGFDADTFSEKEIEQPSNLFELGQKQKEPLRALIILPSTLLFNWYEEVKRFTPQFKCTQYVGEERKTKIIHL